MKPLVFTLLPALLLRTSCAYRYDPEWTEWNLNQNQFAIAPTEYWGEWADHQYTPSPQNWRFPFYTLFLDRFVNGDPTNDNINGTYFEHDISQTQMRHGGDVQGLLDSLDYLQGMGIKGLYLAGSIFMNLPWEYDQYSPADLSLLDQHFGTISMWQTAINEIHARGMYVVLDNTFATLSNLIGFDGYLNTSTPFTLREHKVQYKTSRQYADFSFGNSYNKTCHYPKFWNETGFPVESYVTDQMKGCYDSEFDQYGDTEAFGVYPNWRRELSKFASVQDRLREWHPPVRAKLENFYCIMIAQLDIDGYRYDKATQSTVDAMGFMNDAMRRCARRFGKDNFFVPGEITGGNTFGSIYLGRGRQPDMTPATLLDAVTLNNLSADRYFLRAPEHAALDAAAFHYTVYRTFTRFLGMDGNLAAGYDAPANSWVDQWNTFLITNDLTNANTGKFDPRHMYGVTNQDVFRWPAVTKGAERQLLGLFIATLLLPGIPLLLWGEEQAFYVLDNTAENYIYGRQAMSSATAWQDHSCYAMGSVQFYHWPVDSARHGCHDKKNSRDHRDPAAPMRNIIRHMYQLRNSYPVLNDGFFLQTLSNMTENVFYPGSSGVATVTGLWSVVRMPFLGVQDFTGIGQGNTPVWLIYSNLNRSKTYEFDCRDNATGLNTTSLLAPFDGGTFIKNLFPPYDELILENSTTFLGINGSTNPNGCLGQLEVNAYGFSAYVPFDVWVPPLPMITRFVPGHDARIESTVGPDGREDIKIEIHFSVPMDCDSVTNGVSIISSIMSKNVPIVTPHSVRCGPVYDSGFPQWNGLIGTEWGWSATLENVQNGVHRVTVHNASALNDWGYTNSIDHFLFRIGQPNNPMVFPRSGNYSETLLVQDDSGQFYLNHSAPGADLWRYSTNWGTTFSEWMPYTGGQNPIEIQEWTGTRLQRWKGKHVRVEYWSRLTGSADHVQEGDLDYSGAPRRYPHVFLEGPYNEYGYDAGLENEMELKEDGLWDFHFLTEWPALAQVNIWGIDPNGKPDQTWVMGDVDGDSVLDRMPPSALSPAVINITVPPPSPYVAWRLKINDGTGRFHLIPDGSMWWQLILFVLFSAVPLFSGIAAVWSFMLSFYGVKFNEIGIQEDRNFFTLLARRYAKLNQEEDDLDPRPSTPSSTGSPTVWSKFQRSKFFRPSVLMDHSWREEQSRQRTVLIATMEYDIEDWSIKIKIGGLGVMAHLMGKHLIDQDLIWVVPCVGGVDYPVDRRAPPMTVKILGNSYKVQVQYHKFKNITYVLLDAPIFRQQSKAEPYPARMDDLGSALYYSAWNQCIAQAIERFPIDIYHINDYHGCIAPLYLLPSTIPVCLSLHNAEFQGLWPMRTRAECQEISGIFNLPSDFVQRFVQFGEVFNLLHCGASYLRVYQQGFGAVGVSKKYGKRSYLRYPIFWGLKKVGQLPNPDPSDIGEWDKKLPREEDITVDPEFEELRPELKRQAQEWAGLEQNPDAELFVFVGRWSMQKGVDLIADVFPSILESHPNVQLICIGPVIDLYGRFAALKLDRMMRLYPGRVFSKPVFTALPPYIFSGAEFALIPSRDEPFGLVAVEFGRKGALGVGARVGGLGQMPGWWFTVESMRPSHLLHQFRMAIEEALSSKPEIRAMMRARSAKQRFPVAQWKEDLLILHAASIRIHGKKIHNRPQSSVMSGAQPSSVETSSRPQSLAANSHSAPSADSISRPPPIRNSSTESASGRFGSLRALETPRSPNSDESSPSSRLAAHSRHFQGQIYTTLPPATPDGSDDESTPFEARDADVGVGESEDITAHTLMPQLHVSPENDNLPVPSNSTSDDDRDDPEPAPILSRARACEVVRVHRQVQLFDYVPQSSLLSFERVVGEKKDFKLQRVDPFFNDTNGEYYEAFRKKLDVLNGSNSESLCIEEYLMKSEKNFFADYRKAKLGATPPSTVASLYSSSSSTKDSSLEADSHDPTSDGHENPMNEKGTFLQNSMKDPWQLGDNYVPPKGLKKWMQVRFGDWPVYAFLLAFGQIIAANSYQIALLTGTIGESADKLYVLCSLYLGASIMWWMVFRKFGALPCLSLPFFFYGLAFFFIGIARFGPTPSSRGWLQDIATGAYTVASASGSLFFSLNFGDEGGATVRTWIFRACVVQGSQQMYVTVLWFWGSYLNRQRLLDSMNERFTVPFSQTWKITAIGIPIACTMWLVGVILHIGLPSYYRQLPGILPGFYKTLTRRKIIIWFFITVVIQNFFLSTQYGRSWSFLFSSQHTSWWQIYCLVVFFFVGIWTCFMWCFSLLTHSHSWILPIFAIGLGAPRFLQLWWGTSNMGQHLGFAPFGYLGSAIFSRSLWLWLGVLDSVQGVGFGMILLGTLTRVHVAFTLIVTQVVGSATTAVARACAPNNSGPGPVFPDVIAGVGKLVNPAFLLALTLNLVICLGFFKFFRKEQLTKP